MKIVVLCGGLSTERNISLISGTKVCMALRARGHKAVLVDMFMGLEEGPEDPASLFEDLPEIMPRSFDGTAPDLDLVRASRKGDDPSMLGPGVIEICRAADVVFMALHGANGEDGTVQGLFEVADVPFVGPDHTSSGVCMDKSFTKLIINEESGIRQAKAVILTKKKYERDVAAAFEKIREIGYPVFVKPARAGSSVGVKKVKEERDLADALTCAFAEDEKILIEEFIDGREIEVAVMESEGEVKASVPGEIDPGFEFYDYDTKYRNDTASYYIPARLDGETAEKIRKEAVKIFTALDCRTLSRVDFFVTKDNDIVFNEINTIPGFTPISMYPKLFINSGMTYSEVITALVTSALKK